ncbi:hypothetical protein AHAS_Ahas08G0143100 [Arachis hypogaea]
MSTVMEKEKEEEGGEEEVSPIEQVRLTVTNSDDPSQPVWTFRMWSLGLFSCCLLSFLNQFFAYRTEPLIISQITVQVATLPIGQFMAAVLPTTEFGIGSWKFSFNPGPFNMKEHVLITIFANAGSAFGSGSPYAVAIVTIIKIPKQGVLQFVLRSFGVQAKENIIHQLNNALDKEDAYRHASRSVHKYKFVLGYGWAGLLRKYVVEPAQMWWPSTLVQVSLFRFAWYIVPGYLFSTLSSISWICWAFPKSITAQQIGSGMKGLGLGVFTLDWTVIASFLYSPLISPFFAIVNVFIGYSLIVYGVIPIVYWAFNVYNAHNFPIFSSDLFTTQGQQYDIRAIVNDKFQIDYEKYYKQGPIQLSVFFSLTYGFGFATIAATLTHVVCFYGSEIMGKYRASSKGKEDIHTRLMKRYKDIPSWWFYVLLALTLLASLLLCILGKEQVQMPWWGLIFASALAFIFTLPISIITATTNQTPGLNIITEYIFGLIYTGRPIANVCFKTYGYISMAQAVSFLADFKLGHYMKIPPRSMFLVQFIGTILAGTINIGVAWWLLTSVDGICHPENLPLGSPWTCPGDRVFFDASVIWGLVGPKKIFGSKADYHALNWFFFGGAMGPIILWLLYKVFPKYSWIPLINLPVLLGSTAVMPPATAVNFNSWIVIGTIFNYFIFRYRKKWWQRYNYVLSAALDAGVAFMAVLLYFALGLENKSISWWGTQGEHCPLATCPTAKGIVVEGCPVH